MSGDIGLLQPGCPRCGWLSTPWLDVPENRNAAMAEVVTHIANCPTAEPTNPDPQPTTEDA